MEALLIDSISDSSDDRRFRTVGVYGDRIGGGAVVALPPFNLIIKKNEYNFIY